jgi:CIC family chloride channel protein
MLSRLKIFLPGENTRMIIIAAFIGIMAGIAIIVFREAVELVHEQIFLRGYELLQIDSGGWRKFLLPLLPMTGMVLLVPLSLLFPGKVNGYGFPKFLRRVNLENGVIHSRNIFIKIVSTAITIGTGNSAGVEGPIAVIGGCLGSKLGQEFRVSGKRMKVYIAAGCAGGIAGIFNAPLAGMFFAAEIVLLGTYEISSFSALVIASALSTVVSRAWFGEVPAFPIPNYHMVNPFVEMPLYAIMALLIGLLAVLHIRFFYFIRDSFQALPIHDQVKPILGALLVGTGMTILKRRWQGIPWFPLCWRLFFSNPLLLPLRSALAAPAVSLLLPFLSVRFAAGPSAVLSIIYCRNILRVPVPMRPSVSALFWPPQPMRP